MRRALILVCVLLMSLLGWQANADHCAARDGGMSARTMSMDDSDAMPCHDTGGMAGHDKPEPADDKQDTLCCCAVALVSTAAVATAELARPEADGWVLSGGLSSTGTAPMEEPPPPRS
jgi:hypothetical protein